MTVRDVTRHAELPLHPPYLVDLGGSIRLVEKRVIASREVDVHRFRIELLERARADARAFDDLSELDRAIVKRGLTDEYLKNGTPFTGTFSYEFAERSPTDSSIVAADGDVLVAYGGDTLRLRSTGPETVVEQDVRYELAEVAPDRSAAREYVVREYVRNVSTGDVPAAQREILAAAIRSSDGYREAGRGSEPFRALRDRLDAAPQVPNDGRYVRYDGTIYRVALTGVEV